MQASTLTKTESNIGIEKYCNNKPLPIHLVHCRLNLHEGIRITLENSARDPDVVHLLRRVFVSNFPEGKQTVVAIEDGKKLVLEGKEGRICCTFFDEIIICLAPKIIPGGFDVLRA
jgi:hypothetical protein